MAWCVKRWNIAGLCQQTFHFCSADIFSWSCFASCWIGTKIQILQNSCMTKWFYEMELREIYLYFVTYGLWVVTFQLYTNFMKISFSLCAKTDIWYVTNIWWINRTGIIKYFKKVSNDEHNKSKGMLRIEKKIIHLRFQDILKRITLWTSAVCQQDWIDILFFSVYVSMTLLHFDQPFGWFYVHFYVQ